MGFDIIKRLSERFLELCRARKIRYAAQIVTNGYLLSAQVAKQLSELGVLSAQITIDGPPEIHDQRRVLANGESTFWRILNNIKVASEVMEVNLRVNIDKTNISEASKLLDVLEKEGLRDKISIYYARTTLYGTTCADWENVCMSPEEFNKEYSQAMLELLDRGFDAWQKPRRRANACNADALSAFMILPNGNIHKCWIGTGTLEESLVGNVFKEGFNNNWLKWLSTDVFDSSKCRDCKILPLCMGGCPAIAMKKPAEKRICEFYNEEALLEHMRLFVEYGMSLKNKSLHKQKQRR